MKVSDIMTKDVVYVFPETSVLEVARILFEKNFNGLPVVENRVAIGMITEDDFLTKDSVNIHIPSLIKLLSGFRVSEKASSSLKKSLEELLNANARSIMKKDFVAVSPYLPVTALVKKIEETNANPIPVLDEKKKIVGIVSKADVIRLFGALREEEIDFLLK